MTKVSVIIPAYNAMTFLPEALDSVFKQTFQNYEVLIVNDGSSDGIEEWATQITDLRVSLISQANQGSAAARNTGLVHARGEYVAFLDADDVWVPTKLEKQVRILEENFEIGLVYSWVGSIDYLGKVYGKVRKNSAAGDVWKTIIEHNIIECGSNPMVRQSCFEAVGNFDPKISYAQDWEMWLRIAARYHFGVIKEPLIYYRAHNNNKSKNWKIMEKNYNIIIEKSFENVPTDKLKFKNCCYGFAYFRIAWKSLQNLDGEYKLTLHYLQQAVKKYPQLQCSHDYIRLFLAIMLVRLFGIQGYRRIRNLFYVWKQSLSKFAV